MSHISNDKPPPQTIVLSLSLTAGGAWICPNEICQSRKLDLVALLCSVGPPLRAWEWHEVFGSKQSDRGERLETRTGDDPWSVKDRLVTVLR